MKSLKYKEWFILDEEEKIQYIKEIMSCWENEGISFRCDARWFYTALEQGYTDDFDTLEQAMNIVNTMGNATVNKERDMKIIKAMSKVSEKDLEIYNYCQNKLDDLLKDIISDEEFDEVMKSVAEDLNISIEKAELTWMKVDAAKTGIER